MMTTTANRRCSWCGADVGTGSFAELVAHGNECQGIRRYWRAERALLERVWEAERLSMTLRSDGTTKGDYAHKAF